MNVKIIDNGKEVYINVSQNRLVSDYIDIDENKTLNEYKSQGLYGLDGYDEKTKQLI